MRPPGSPKTPGSGRKKGTPNKKTGEVAQLFQRLNSDPLEVLALMAKGDWAALGYKKPPPMKLALELRFWAAKEGAQYLHPKRKAIEVKAEVESKGTGVIVVPGRALTPEQWTELAAQAPKG
jgi:hypothetical protein